MIAPIPAELQGDSSRITPLHPCPAAAPKFMQVQTHSLPGRTELGPGTPPKCSMHHPHADHHGAQHITASAGLSARNSSTQRFQQGGSGRSKHQSQLWGKGSLRHEMQLHPPTHPCLSVMQGHLKDKVWSGFIQTFVLPHFAIDPSTKSAVGSVVAQWGIGDPYGHHHGGDDGHPCSHPLVPLS